MISTLRLVVVARCRARAGGRPAATRTSNFSSTSFTLTAIFELYSKRRPRRAPLSLESAADFFSRPAAQSLGSVAPSAAASDWQLPKTSSLGHHRAARPGRTLRYTRVLDLWRLQQRRQQRRSREVGDGEGSADEISAVVALSLDPVEGGADPHAIVIWCANPQLPM